MHKRLRPTCGGAASISGGGHRPPRLSLLEKRERRFQFLAATSHLVRSFTPRTRFSFPKMFLRGQHLFDTLGPAHRKLPQRLAPALHRVPFLDTVRKARKSRLIAAPGWERAAIFVSLRTVICNDSIALVVQIMLRICSEKSKNGSPAPSCPGSSDSAVLPFST